MSLSTSVEPFFAPLSRPMIEQALALESPSLPVTPKLDVSQVVSDFTAKCSQLRARFTQKRGEIFELMQPAIRSKVLDTQWMLKTLTQFTPKRNPQKSTPVSAETISRWRELGLIKYQAKDLPDYDSSAAVLTLRLLISQKERGWLPKPPKDLKNPQQYFSSEPLWYAWRQDSPDSPILPCPVNPFPEDLPRHALLWTDWLGASWDPTWLRIGNLGCCRWAGTVMREDTLLWSVDEHDLELWSIPISERYKRALASDIPLTLHTLASSALLVLATERMENLDILSLSTLPKTF